MESRKICKRDGRIESWSTGRIGDAIFKAFKAANIKDRMMADRLARKVEEIVFEDGKVFAEQEFVQDTVESVLMKSGFDEIARRYIIYREQRRAARSLDMTYMLDSKNIIETYQDRSDWRVNENANMGQSLAGLILHMQGEMQKNYALNNVYPKEIREAHVNGYFHIHDLSFGLTGYCSGWSVRDILLDGFFIPNACAAGPAKHLSAIMGQCVNFLGTLQNEWAGAQALNNFDTYLAPFIREEQLSYPQVKQLIQNFVHSMNTTSRWGSQSPFTNLTFDMTCPKHMEKEPVIIGGKYQDTTYGDYQVEMDMFNKAFIEVLMKGDHHGRIFSFPIPTYNVTKDFPWESENVQLLMKMTAKYGIPYFQNFINSDLNPEDVRSMCPLHPSEKVYVQKDGDDGTIYKQTMQQYWDERANHTYKVFDRGNWYPATMTKIKSEGCIKITLENGATIVMDVRHEQPIRSIVTGDICTLTAEEILESLYTVMQLPYQSTKLDDVIEWKNIVSIEKVDYFDDVYCFVVNNLDHLFLTYSGIVTHNCRLQMDLREIRKKTGGLFGAGDLTGSIGVVTLNLSKLAYLSQDENEFLELITEYANLAKDSLEIKRKFIQTQLDAGQMPWTQKYLKNGYKAHFSTIGINAGHEACMNLLHKGIDTSEGTTLMVKVLNHLRDLTKQYQEETGNLYNLESSPAEGVAYRLAKIDKDLYGNGIFTSGTPEAPYYTNSTNLSVGFTDDVFTALEHQNKLQPLYTGGTVHHTYLGEALPDAEAVKSFLLKAMTLTKIPYISITPTFSICSKHGYITGEHFNCPTCNQETEVYSRIVGYYRPISRWNKGKKSEYAERKEYKIDQSVIILDTKDGSAKPKVTNIVSGELV